MNTADVKQTAIEVERLRQPEGASAETGMSSEDFSRFLLENIASMRESQSLIPARQAVCNAVACIPQDRNSEMLREMSDAANKNDAALVRDTIIRWVMIGAFYADPNREQNHPLASLFGSMAGNDVIKRMIDEDDAKRHKSIRPRTAS